MAPLDLADTLYLCDAARWVYQQVLSEGLPLAHIAEQSGRPQYWFANSMLHIVDVEGRRANADAAIPLTRGVLAANKLADDMQGLVDPDTGDVEFADLQVTPEQRDRYMDWARTVS
jgi:hypothetical protein